ncbi:MAG: hypothetical protein Fur002_24370 [Anaerolineales bacterium]
MMKTSYSFWRALWMFALLTALTTQPAAAQTPPTLSFVANIETAGVALRGENLPNSAELLYRPSGEALWRTGQRMVKIKDGRLIGSLFNLAPSTSYEVIVRSGAQELIGAFTTQAETPLFTPAQILYVDDSAAPSGDGSAAAPFQTIQTAVERAAPGAQILVADGVYREEVIFPNSGGAQKWIQVKAAGNGAILDGSYDLSGAAAWTAQGGGVWYAHLNTPIRYLARDGQRFYLYDSLGGLMNASGHNQVPMSEGWYMDANTLTLYVRSASDPSQHVWQVPFLNAAFSADAKDWIWIEGFEVRYYGAYDSCGICFRNSSHIVIRNNRVHHVQKGIFIDWTGGEGRADDTRIEFNEIYDPPVESFPWQAAKGTTMEGTAILLRGHTGGIVRGNHIHHFFNGIYTGSSAALNNPALAFDADIYDNRLHHLSDDALEPEGACVNHRFRRNVISSVLVGVSLAPISIGPTWVIRNTISNYSGRAVKLDRNSDGYVFFYHNSSWSAQAFANAIDVIDPVRNTTLRNNIFESKGYAVREIVTGSANNNWNDNNWSVTYNPRYRWENVSYNTLAGLCAKTKLACSGTEAASGLSDPANGNFALLSSSPNIDRAAPLPNINDQYAGKAPDIGAVEYGFSAAAIATPAAPLTPAPSALPATSTPAPTTPPPATDSPQSQTMSAVFQSIGAQDGWILESGESTRKGGKVDRISPLIYLGDDAKDKQYVGVLSFDASSLPSGATITAVQLNVKIKDAVGTNPLETHGALLAEILRGSFSGNAELVADDFSASASAGAAQERLNAAGGWLLLSLSEYNFAYINVNGLTQFRLSFSMDDNDDMNEDALRIYSGNAELFNQPQLIVTYAP